MTRRELREQIFMLLFRNEFHDAAQMDEQIETYREFAENPALEEDDENEDEVDKDSLKAYLLMDEPREPVVIEEKDLDYITAKCRAVINRLSDIDGLLSGNTEKWDISRIGKAELTILRLALYEMIYDDNIPLGVAINEAVELAKKYCQEEGAPFVNGILAKLARKVNPKEAFKEKEGAPKPEKKKKSEGSKNEQGLSDIYNRNIVVRRKHRDK